MGRRDSVAAAKQSWLHVEIAIRKTAVTGTQIADFAEYFINHICKLKLVTQNSKKFIKIVQNNQDHRNDIKMFKTQVYDKLKASGFTAKYKTF